MKPDLAKIRLAVDHYESITERLRFEVHTWDDTAKNPPRRRYSVRPLNPGMSVQYPTFDDMASAQRVVSDFNERSWSFLEQECAVLRRILREEGES